MLSHVLLGTNDMARAIAFYDELLALLDAKEMWRSPRTKAWGDTSPKLGVCMPYDGGVATAGNGTTTALTAPTRAMVDQFHAKALELGGTDEGAPGIRGEDPDGFYGAYFRDLDGNKICVYRYGPA